MKVIKMIIENWDSISAAVSGIIGGLLVISEVMGASKKSKFNGIAHAIMNLFKKKNV